MNYRTPENISSLEVIIKEYNALLDEFAIIQIHRGTKLKLLQKVCDDFLNRTRINNEALIPLLENYKTKMSGILPIGLLVRSILSDFLAFCYLATFSNEKDINEVSIQNELDLLERDFLKSKMEVSEFESKIDQYNNISPVFEDAIPVGATSTSRLPSRSVRRMSARIFQMGSAVEAGMKRSEDDRARQGMRSCVSR